MIRWAVFTNKAGTEVFVNPAAVEYWIGLGDDEGTRLVLSNGHSLTVRETISVVLEILVGTMPL